MQMINLTLRLRDKQFQLAVIMYIGIIIMYYYLMPPYPTLLYKFYNLSGTNTFFANKVLEQDHANIHKLCITYALRFQ